MNPKVSVLMSVYNGRHFLSETISSILNQSYKDFEFIIVDDGSFDDSIKIISDFSNKDNRIKFTKNEKNLGLTMSLNKGLSFSSGEYIARIDAGDLSAPDRLKKQVDFLDNNKDIGLVGSFMYVIDTNRKILKKVNYPTEDNFLKKVLINYNPFAHSSIMFRRNIGEKVGFYSEDCKFSQDYDFYFKLLPHTKFANIPEYLISYMYYSESITFTKNKKQILFANRARIKAIRNNFYSKFCYFYVFKNFLILLIPLKLKLIIKRFYENTLYNN